MVVFLSINVAMPVPTEVNMAKLSHDSNFAVPAEVSSIDVAPQEGDNEGNIASEFNSTLDYTSDTTNKTKTVVKFKAGAELAKKVN